MEVSVAWGVHMPAPGLEFNVTIEQVQLLAQFPDAATQRIKQWPMTKLRHPDAELAKAGGLLPEGRCLVTPLSRIPGQQTFRAFVESLRLRTFLMRQVVAVAEKDQVLQS